MNIIQKPSPNFGDRKGHSIQIIVVHIMDGTLAGTDSWFATPLSQVSSHYGIGLNGEIHQYVKDDKEAWTEGNIRNPSAKILIPNVNPNLYCLSIENEGHDISKAPMMQLNCLVELIKSLSLKYSIPMDRNHIIGHFEIDSVVKNNCPSPDHSIMDKIVAMCLQDEMVTIQIPKSKLGKIEAYLLTI